MRLALKIDVDTRRGMDEGVPRLLETLARAGLRATFFVTMGPDNSGKAALRVFRRKGFAGKMVRTNALRMYGLRTALSGTLLPARPVGSGRPDLMRAIVAAGHEAGVHGWDHVLWHDRILGMPEDEAAGELRKAADAFAAALGRPPDCASAPGWVVSAGVLGEEERLALRYAADVRGRAPFLPSCGGRAFRVPQVPTTLPTLDEMLGRDGVTEGNFAERLLGLAEAAGGDQVFTLHAEAEGMSFHACLDDLLRRMADRGIPAVPCGAVLGGAPLAAHAVATGEVPGRAGPISVQGEALRG
jgi:undecaprenyl phosphate-alpha-L-ara4FN deformylase